MRPINRGQWGPDTCDYGPEPFVTNVNLKARQNPYFRTTLWTGTHMQMTLMCIPVGGDVGLEVHTVDQYLRIEDGCGVAMMGPDRERLNHQRNVCENDAIFVPSGTWHNLVNSGNRPLKISSLYAPPQHPHGTVHETQELAEEQHD